MRKDVVVGTVCDHCRSVVNEGKQQHQHFLLHNYLPFVLLFQSDVARVVFVEFDEITESLERD